MRTGLDFWSAQFDHARGEADDWIKIRGPEIQSELEDLKWHLMSINRY
jgi:hypothetical protein